MKIFKRRLNPLEELLAGLAKRININMLHIPNPEIFLAAQAWDGDGCLIYDSEQRAKSFTRNYYNALFSMMGFDAHITGDSTTFGPGSLVGMNRLGDVRTPTVNYMWRHENHLLTEPLQINAPAGNASNGILVGTDTTAESFESYNLGARIAHGSGAGQLAYQDTEPRAHSYNSGTKEWISEWARYFNNNSGGSIVVAETGIISALQPMTAIDYPYLIERSLLSPAITLPNAGQLKITYRFKQTFPA